MLDAPRDECAPNPTEGVKADPSEEGATPPPVELFMSTSHRASSSRRAEERREEEAFEDEEPAEEEESANSSKGRRDFADAERPRRRSAFKRCLRRDACTAC